MLKKLQLAHKNKNDELNELINQTQDFTNFIK